MSSEFVRLTLQEKIYGQRNLLESQLEVIDMLKRMKNYKSLRQEELALKIAARKRLDEINNLCLEIDKLLPKAHLNLPKVETPQEHHQALKEEHVIMTLEDEVEAIKKKIQRLS